MGADTRMLYTSKRRTVEDGDDVGNDEEDEDEE